MVGRVRGTCARIMLGLSHIATHPGGVDSPLGPVSDLALYRDGAAVRVYAVSRTEARITAFDAVPGAARLIDIQNLPGTVTPLGGLGIGLVEIGTGTYAVGLSATPAGLPGFRLEPDGSMTDGLSVLRGPDLGPEIAALVQTRDWLITAERGEPGLSLYRVQADGTLGATAPGAGAAASHMQEVTALALAEIGPDSFVLAADAGENRLCSWRLGENGTLEQAGSLGAAEGLGIATPTALEVVFWAGQHFAIVGAAGSSSLSVLQIGADGGLTASDHLVDDLSTRFQGLSALEVVKAEGRVYVIAGGADDGVSVFTLLPDGRLLHRLSIADTDDLNLDNVSALAAAVRDGGIDLFTGSATEAGLGQYRIDLETAGTLIRADAAGGRRDGTDDADILQGGMGKDDLRGGAGGDILMDGFGTDRLYGGAGADIFVMEADGTGDQIRDFEAGQDRIDLSAWAMLRSVAQLEISSLSNGGSIRYRDENIRLYSSDLTPLSVEEIAAAILPDFQHYPVAFLSADLILTGTTGDDTLRGRAGDDMLYGLEGADLLIGGDGMDTAAYTGTKGVMLVDLKLSHLNTNTARGDVFDGIENLRGSASRDDLRGDENDNILEGGTSADRLTGRDGDDELRGGMGFDILTGGRGADRLKGGPLRDRADYSDSMIGLTVDLAQRANNTGIARGDSYLEVEDIGGSGFGDALYGDGGGNTLFGMDGDDLLFGRGGDDLLIGSTGDDRLDGGGGVDVLRGGLGADTFVFRKGTGHDTVFDFFRGHGDRIALDSALWSGGLDAGQVIARFGAITGEGLVLDFGTDRLLIERLSTWQAVEDRLDIL